MSSKTIIYLDHHKNVYIYLFLLQVTLVLIKGTDYVCVC